MNKKLSLLLSIIFLSISVYAQSKIEISLKNNTQAEIKTKEQLLKLLKNYDLSKWTFTKTIMIDEKSIPHSHPVLTLSTRHLKDDELLLSTFVHEQLHWYLASKSKETEDAYSELRAMFPKVPAGFPQGANDEESTYKHILVCYLEYQAVKELLGELKAKPVREFWATDHYTP